MRVVLGAVVLAAIALWCIYCLFRADPVDDQNAPADADEPDEHSQGY